MTFSFHFELFITEKGWESGDKVRKLQWLGVWQLHGATAPLLPQPCRGLVRPIQLPRLFHCNITFSWSNVWFCFFHPGTLCLQHQQLPLRSASLPDKTTRYVITAKAGDVIYLNNTEFKCGLKWKVILTMMDVGCFKCDDRSSNYQFEWKTQHYNCLRDSLKDQTELQKGFTIKVPLTVNTSPFKII